VNLRSSDQWRISKADDLGNIPIVAIKAKSPKKLKRARQGSIDHTQEIPSPMKEKDTTAKAYGTVNRPDQVR